MKQIKLIPLLGLGLTLFLSKPHLIYANSGYGGGTGTEIDPYLISTPEQLIYWNQQININQVKTKGVHYKLTNDIDFSGYDTDTDESNGNWTPIETFGGTFDGNRHVIYNIKINLPETERVGFISYLNSFSTIQGLGLENVEIEGKNYVGGLVGYTNYPTIFQSYTTGKIVGFSQVGGLVGFLHDGIVECFSDADIIGNTNVGGLVGFNYDSTGIESSYATGDVTGVDYVGGIAGDIEDGFLKSSYATGKVTATGDKVGGLVGSFLFSSGTNNYWNVESTGQPNGVTGTGLTTAQMTGEAAKTNMIGFDFDMVWKTTDSYPKLQWQPEEIIESTDTVKDVTVNGTVQTMVADIMIPSVSPDLMINPNLPEGFVAPKFSVSNDSVSPIKLELKTFEQTTNTFNDVMPDKYESWAGLNKQQSRDIALGLVAKEGEGWQMLTAPTSYVANHTDHEIGIIKPTSSVDFSFDVKHGTSFSEAKTVQYKMVFVFDLMN